MDDDEEAEDVEEEEYILEDEENNKAKRIGLEQVLQDVKDVEQIIRGNRVSMGLGRQEDVVSDGSVDFGDLIQRFEVLRRPEDDESSEPPTQRQRRLFEASGLEAVLEVGQRGRQDYSLNKGRCKKQ